MFLSLCKFMYEALKWSFTFYFAQFYLKCHECIMMHDSKFKTQFNKESFRRSWEMFSLTLACELNVEGLRSAFEGFLISEP